MKVTKMHGTGNDYVFVHCFDEHIADPPATARRIADRHTGVGGDGLIMICPSEIAPVRMEMYNNDGSRAQMCGNGLRCVAKYAFDHGLTDQTSIPIETDDGLKIAECTLENGKVSRVRIDMGLPRFAPTEIPVNLSGDCVQDATIKIRGRDLKMTCISMGNPHAVFFLDSFNQISHFQDGPAIENHPLFPERVNAHFVTIENRSRVNVLTWERGTGRTLACGTGVSAVCVAGVKTARTDRRIIAKVEGGELELEWADDNRVFKTGPAVEVFQADWRA